METNALEEITDYCKSENRICPQPQLWNSMWAMLKDKVRKPSGGFNPPAPLILAAWWETSDTSKQMRLMEHLVWADNHNQLNEITGFLINLSEDQWHHINE